MGLWTCFWGRKHRVRLVEGDSRVRRRNRDGYCNQAAASDLHGLDVQPISSANEACAYEELSQPKQAICGASHGTKLFRRKVARRARSCGSTTAFENGAKRLLDKNAETRPTFHLDQLQEEVEGLRKRLAEEEEEARKLRHEVCYLRSCGVLQSPDRRSRCNFEKDSLLPKDDKSQRNWQSWLGITLSPASRLKLEEQLRHMAAEEMSKVSGKDLTNGQKAMIVATKLWHYQERPQQKRDEIVVGSFMSNAESYVGDIFVEKQLLSEEVVGDRVCEVRKQYADSELIQAGQVLRFRDILQLEDVFSSTSKATELSRPQSTCEPGGFSFRPLASGDNFTTRQTSWKSPVKDTSGEYRSCSVEMKLDLESTRSLSSTSMQDTDPDQFQARRFIDLRYQELEEKLLRSPKKEKVLGTSKSGSSSPIGRGSPPRNVVKVLEHGALHVLHDVNNSEPQSSLGSEDLTCYVDCSGSSCPPVIRPFVACTSGRLWQPLSPIWEAESALSSREDLQSTCASHLLDADCVDSTNISESISSVRSTSGSEWAQEEESPRHSEVPDDDLFTLSPRRLHHGYNPWYTDHRSDDEVLDESKVESIVSSGPVAACSEEAELDFLLPIQCQSPSFSPKQKSWRNKAVKGELKLEEYARDKNLQEMSFKVDELVSSSDSSSIPSDSPSAGKENRSLRDIPLPVLVGQVMITGPPPKEVTSTGKKVVIANDVALFQDYDHPVLASIENLPKWIECQGISCTPADKESQFQVDTHTSEIREIVTSEEHGNEWSALECSLEASQQGTQLNPQIQHVGEEPELAMKCGEQAKKENLLLTLEISVRQDVLRPQSEFADSQEGESSRRSLHGFVYRDKRVLQQCYCSSAEDQVKQQPSGQMELIMLEDEASNNGRPGDFALLQNRVEEGNVDVSLEIREQAQNVALVDGQERVTTISQGSTGPQADNCQDENCHQQTEMQVLIMENDFRPDTWFSGYGAQFSGFGSSFPGTELVFQESLPVSIDSDGSSVTSRDGDETFHDCESPSHSEGHLQAGQCNSPLVKVNVANVDLRPSKFDTVGGENCLLKTTLEISPDDRPILGTVATYWGETNKSNSRREWDGQGIPNSTTKFKEDQKVNWHTTPFETRLEQALARQPLVPEMCDPRKLFDGISL